MSLNNDKYDSSMKSLNTAKVGSKGEILPKKQLRKVSDIQPGDIVLIEAKPGEIRIRKIYTVKEAMSMPIISEGTPDEIEKEILEEMRKQNEESGFD